MAKLKTIKIQGKDYTLVSDRVLFFNETYPNGSIVTQLLDQTDNIQVFIKATITPDCDKPERFFTGHAQEIVGQGMVNKTSALENCETSAVGRALGLMGIGVVESIASADEVNKAVSAGKKASDKQIKFIEEMLYSLNIPIEEYEEKIGTPLKELNLAQASKCIGTLKGRIDTRLEEETTKADKQGKEFLGNNYEEINQRLDGYGRGSS